MAERTYKVRLEAEYSAFVQAMGQAATSVDKIGDAADKASKRVDTATKAQADAAGRVRVAEQQLADARAKHPAQSAQVVTAEERVAKARRDLDKATEETTAAEAALRAEMGRTDAAAKSQETAIGRLTESAERNSQAWDRAGTALTAFGAITTVALGATVKAAMNWESAWTGVLKTADGSSGELAVLEDDLRKLARTLPATHQEIAAVAEAAGQLGVGVNSVATFTKTMIDLGETTNLSADEAATAIAQMANVMDPSLLSSADGASRFGATLVALGNDGASTEKQILEMAQRISGSGKLVGASSAEVLALSNALASMGITAELGGGVVSRILQDIYSAVKEGGPKLAQFAALAGQSADEFAKAFADDPVRALDAVAQGLNGVDASGGNVVGTLKDLGFLSTEEQRVLLQLKGAGDLLTESLNLANAAWAENSALIEEASKRYDTAEAKVQIAKNSINDAAITIGDALLPAVAAAAEGVADLATWFGSLPVPVQQAIGGLGGLVGVTALAAGGFLLLFPRVIDTVAAFRDLRDISPGAANGLGTVGKAAGVAAVAITTMMAASALPKWGVETAEGASEAAKSLLDIASGAKTADQAFSGMFSKGGFKDWITGNDIDNVREAYNVLKDPTVSQNIDNTISSVLTLGQATSTNRLQSEELFKAIDKGAASLAQSGALKEAKAGLEALGLSVEKDKDLLPLYAEALASADVQQQITGQSAGGLAGSLEGVAPASTAAQEALAEWSKMVGDADASFSDIGAAYQGVIDKNKEVAQATADATKSSKDSWEDFYDGTSVSMDDWIAKLEEQAKAQANWQDNIMTITSEIRQQMPAEMVATADAMIDELIAMGDGGAAALQTFREASAEERIRLVEAWSGAGFEINEDVASGLASARAEIPVGADVAPALEGLAAVLAQADSATGTITVAGDQGPVSQTLEGVRASIDDASGTVSILGEDGQAVTTLSNFTYTVNKTTGKVTIQGNDAEGRATVVGLRGWIDAQGASVTVSADTSPAERAVGRAIAAIRTMTSVIPVIPGGFTGGQIGPIAGFASGGQIPGMPPADPTRDNVLAMTERGRPIAVRSREWIQPEESVDYYGPAFMAAIQHRRFPKGALEGYASGGSLSRNYAHTGVDNAPAYTPSRAVPAGALYSAAPAAAQAFDLNGLQLVGTLMVNGLEGRMEAVAVGVVDERDRSDGGTRQTRGWS
ncbi:phage tail tape measure protein [Oerskovia paurometabola]|uniref:phage tail tape measure protein n=1 Tax=Oerskovia paurometabola TaxID=162170 RepID=UPI0034499846